MNDAAMRTRFTELIGCTLYAGESVGAVTRVQPAVAIVQELDRGAQRLLEAWRG